MYYGNAASANQQNKTGVWDSNYKMVLHLSEPATAGQSSAVFYDSTANGANGTQWGTSTTTGKMASGQSFTETYPGDPPTPAGGNDLINVDNFPTDTWTSFTIESWVYLTGINSITPNPLMRIVNKSNGTLTTNIIMGLSLSYSAPNFDVRAILTDSSANTFTYFSSQAPQYILMNGWHLLGARWDGSNISVFIDGNFIGQTATTDIGATLAASAVNQNMVLGNNLLTDTDRTLVGTLDEVRVSNIGRPNAYMAASYTNQNAPVGAGTQQVFIGGTVYSDEGLTPASGQTVTLLINGTPFANTSISSASGAWGIAVPSLSPGDKIAAYVSGSSFGASATTVNGFNLYNLDLYQNHVIVRNDNGGNPILSDLTAARGGGVVTNFPYDAAGTVANGFTLYVPSGTTFAPGASLNVGTSTSALKVQGSLSLGRGTNTTYLRGSFG